MGVKHLEQIKSIVLFLLVVLSLILTFTIWSYTPNYQYIDETQVDRVTVGEQKKINDIIKPYRIVLREDGFWRGTVSTSSINKMMTSLSSWNASKLEFLQSNLTDGKINDMVRTNNRMTLFFSGEVPIKTFQSILHFEQDDLPNMTFDHLIIDWSKLDARNTLQLFLVSEKNRTLYSTTITISPNYFYSNIASATENSVAYNEIFRENELSLYVSGIDEKFTQFTYYIDDISPELFKEALFTDPSIAKKSVDSSDSEKYTDARSIMTVDKKNKTIHYVYPKTESFLEIPNSDLLYDSFDYVNDHGGFTGDYRYSYINVGRHITEYQLFMEGLPVFSSVTSTRISTTWGENQIFSYRRPYYLLDMDISEKKKVQLPSGLEMIELIKGSDIKMSSIDEILVGYYLVKNENELLHTLEPSWFIIQNGSWTRVTPELLGGVEDGLE
ncbi:hypothetical protein EBB45_13765 [Lysinibacillus composti]|uniref:Regulatory protein YycH domain-containing protein n=1 Tax=Lysinibacillus composti TaxID=720633 RepID=A0A3N9UCE5_9BACI|nr:two-component system activity regulator YycH [Lysinibacillus composti]RQW74007.1 hypothetical protein EBB45_13765 [Lysinibacillus composti]